MTSIVAVHRHDEGGSPAQIQGPHIIWTPARFSSGFNPTTYTQGAQMWLCVGERTLACAELDGAAFQIIDTLTPEADRVEPWVESMTELATAIRAQKTAQHLSTYHRYWVDAVLAVRNSPSGHNVDPDRDPEVLRCKTVVAEIVPAELVTGHILLKDAAAAYMAALAVERDAALVRAVLAAPTGAAIPHLAWTPLYDTERLKEIREGHNAELPRLLLVGWRMAVDANGTTWDDGQAAVVRDRLIRWAVKWNLPRAEISRASGVDRSAIDMILNGPFPAHLK